MDVPKNCWECRFNNNCKAWHYGGGKCEYKHIINRKTVQETLKKV